MKLDGFLKVKEVRFIAKDNHLHLTYGRAYDVIGVSHERIKVHNDKGNNSWYDMDCFEPVLDSAENPLQGVELTPEFETEASEPKFKAGDKVYVGLTGKIAQVTGIIDDDVVNVANKNNEVRAWVSNICHATQENYERLQATFPDIEFEQPTKELTGSDLCRAMLDKGWKYVLCWVSNYGEDMRGAIDFVYSRNHSGQFKAGGGNFNHAVPFDPRTGEPLTESVLDE